MFDPFKKEGNSFSIMILAAIPFLPNLMMQELCEGALFFGWFLLAAFVTQFLYQPLSRSFGTLQSLASGVWIIFWMLLGWKVSRISPLWAVSFLMVFPYYFSEKSKKNVQKPSEFLTRAIFLTSFFIILLIVKEITFRQVFFEPSVFIPVSFFALAILSAVYSRLKADST